jgi:hypothetical protein
VLYGTHLKEFRGCSSGVHQSWPRMFPVKFLWPTGFQHLLTPVKSISSVNQKSFEEIFLKHVEQIVTREMAL